jgi:hypothetical protein
LGFFVLHSDSIDGNIRKIYIRPYSLRADTKAIVIVLTCLTGDFAGVKKLIFTFSEAGYEDFYVMLCYVMLIFAFVFGLA